MRIPLRPRRRHILMTKGHYLVEIAHKQRVDGLWFRPIIRAEEVGNLEWSLGAGRTDVIISADISKMSERRRKAAYFVIVPNSTLRIYRKGLLMASVRVGTISVDYSTNGITIKGSMNLRDEVRRAR